MNQSFSANSFRLSPPFALVLRDRPICVYAAIDCFVKFLFKMNPFPSLPVHDQNVRAAVAHADVLLEDVRQDLL